MPERTVGKQAESNQGSKDALRLSRNPYVREVIRESRTVLQKSFGINPSQFNFATGNLFVPYEERAESFSRHVTFNNVIVGETRSRGIYLKDAYLPQVPYYDIQKDNPQDPADVLISTEPFVHFFQDSIVSKKDQLLASQGSLYLFRSLVQAVTQELTPVVKLEASREVLVQLAQEAVGHIPEYVKNPFDPIVIKLMEDMKVQIKDGEKLSLQAEGAVVGLMLNGRTLDAYYEYEETLLLQMLYRVPEDNLKKRLGNSRINGKRWFIQPEEWPSDYPYREHERGDRFLELKAFLDQRGINDLFPRIVSSEMGLIFLENEGIPFARMAEVEKPQEQNLKEAVTPILQPEIEILASAEIEIGINSPVEKTILPIAEPMEVADNPERGESVDESDENKQKREKKKKGKPPIAPKQIFKRSAKPPRSIPIVVPEVSVEPLDKLIAMAFGDGAEVREEKPKRADEIISLADKTLKDFYPLAYTFIRENVLWLPQDEYQKTYENMPETELNSFRDFLLGNMGYVKPVRRKVPDSAFVDYSFPQPTLCLPSDTYKLLEDQDIEMNNWLEIKLATDIVTNAIFASPIFRDYPRDGSMIEIMKNGLEQKRTAWVEDYPGLDPNKVDSGIEAMSQIVEHDESGQIIFRGMQLIYKLNLSNKGGEPAQFLPLAGEEMDDIVVRYLASKVVGQMITEMVGSSPKNQQAEIKKRYFEHLAELEHSSGEFENVEDFFNKIGVQGYRNIIAYYEGSFIPQLFLEAKIKKPDIAYSI